jgi:hypothetical protein
MGEPVGTARTARFPHIMGHNPSSEDFLRGRLVLQDKVHHQYRPDRE